MVEETITAEAPAPAAAEPTAGRTVLFTAVRNEAPFLLEWLAYHKAIGFEEIIVYANPSDDGTDELLAALDEAGEISLYHHDVPEGVSPQANAARLANEAHLLREGDWVIWLDADEFLCVNRRDGTVGDLINGLQAMGNKKGVLISWRLFGDGGTKQFTGRFVSKDYTKSARRYYRRNLEQKTFFRMGDWIEGFATVGINRPKIRAGSDVELSEFVSGTGAMLSGAFRPHAAWIAGQDVTTTRRIATKEHGYRLAQINHYSARTREHFALKKQRGRGWAVAQAGETNQRHTAEFYNTLNRNDVEDRQILRFESQVTEGIARMRTHPKVAAAEDKALKVVAERIAAIPQEELDAFSAAAAKTAAFRLTLPEDAAALVRDSYAEANTVLEYGSGGSTVLAVQSGVSDVFSVESDKNWSERLKDALDEDFPDHGCRLHYANIGPTEAWGRTTDTSGFARYHSYPLSVWDRDDFVQPDVILIDGRFRVACLLAALMRSKTNVTILFDDYTDRPEYHWIEKIVAPVSFAGRMARFEAGPMPIPANLLTQAIGAFVDQR